MAVLQILEDYVSDQLSWPLERATIMLLDGEETVRLFDTSFQVEYKIRNRFLFRLEDLCKDDPENIEHVRALMVRIDEHARSLPGPKRRSADGTLGRLSQLLPEDERIGFLAASIDHERFTRRRTGNKYLRKLASAAFLEELESSYRRYHDKDAILTLAMKGHDVSSLLGPELEAVIESFQDRYHRALILQQVLVNNEALAFSLAPSFPMAFLWAAGRERHSGATTFALAFIENSIEAVNSATDLRTGLEAGRDLSLVVWALERIGARKEIRLLSKRYGQRKAVGR